MSDQETEQIAQALQRYFDNADPNNDELNARLIQNDLRRYDGKLLWFAPVMIKSGLRSILDFQNQQRYSLGITEDELDNQLRNLGLILIISRSRKRKTRLKLNDLSQAPQTYNRTTEQERQAAQR